MSYNKEGTNKFLQTYGYSASVEGTVESLRNRIPHSAAKVKVKSSDRDTAVVRAVVDMTDTDSVDYQKKKSAETSLMQNTSAHTPKAQVGQTSNNSISASAANVKGKLSDRDTAIVRAVADITDTDSVDYQKRGIGCARSATGFKARYRFHY